MSSARKGTRATLRQTEQPGILRNLQQLRQVLPGAERLNGSLGRWFLVYLKVQKSGEVFQTKDISGENSGESCLRVSDGVRHKSAESGPEALTIFT